MKLRAASIITPLLLLILAPAYAIETPRIVPRIQEIQKPVGEVFATLKKYFTDASLSHFELVSADERTHTLVAKQTATDDLTWRTLGILRDRSGSDDLQVAGRHCDGDRQARKSPPHSTLATVSADFQGRYALGGNQNTVACKSKFVLEDRYWPPPARLPPSESPRFD